MTTSERKYWVGLLVSVFMGLGAAVDVMPEAWRPYVTVAGIVGTALSAGAITPPRLRGRLVLVLALAGALTGCATLQAPEGTRQQALARQVDVAVMALKLARAAQDFEVGLHQQGAVSDARHQTVQQSFLAFFAAADAGLAAAGDLTVPEVTREVQVRAVLDAARVLVADLKIGPERLDVVLVGLQAVLGLAL